jgi:hypothetical protein
MMGGATKRPEPLDEAGGDYSNAQTPDSAKAIREFPAEKKLVHFYRNIIDAPAGKAGDRQSGVIVAIPNNKGFADRWRYVRWDENLVDSEAKVEMLWGRYTDFSLFKSCGFDRNGVQAPVALDEEGQLPEASPHRGKYGRSGAALKEADEPADGPAASLPAGAPRGEEARNERAAAEILAMARSAERMGQRDVARSLYRRIVEKFPGTETAGKAKEKIE